jgi:cell wall-associated NlpC family hydrolase
LELSILICRTSFEQSQYGTKINEDARKGDLIFKTNGRRQVNQCRMVVEVNNGDIKFIHASTSSGVIISSIKEKYYSKEFLK